MNISRSKIKKATFNCDMTYDEFKAYYNNCICLGIINEDDSVTINRLCYKIIENEIHLVSCCDYQQYKFFSIGDPECYIKLILPSCVTHIDENAFKGCINITTISGEGVTHIDDNCFNSCFRLEKAYFPNVKSIGSSTFSNCIKLKEITLLNCESVGMCAFSHCHSLKEINAPALIKCSTQAFALCHALTKCSFDSLKFIYEEAFKDCINLKKVYAPKLIIGVPNIKLVNGRVTGFTAFKGCISLTTLQVCIFVGTFEYFHQQFEACNLIYAKNINTSKGVKG